MWLRDMGLIVCLCWLGLGVRLCLGGDGGVWFMSGRRGLCCEFDESEVRVVWLMRCCRLVNPEIGMDVEVRIPCSEMDRLDEMKVELRVAEKDGKVKVTVKNGKVAAGWKV